MMMSTPDSIRHYKAEQTQYKPHGSQNPGAADLSALCCTFDLHQRVAEGDRMR